MFWIKLIVFIFLLSGCTKPSNFSSVQVIGHAGMGLEMFNSMFHDNSKESIEYALKMEGCDGVEVDVQLSSDCEMWLYHDPYLETQTNGYGCISDKNFEELSSIIYKSWKKESLIRLSDLDWTLLIGKKLFLDIRSLNTCNNIIIHSDSILSALQSISFLNNSEIDVIAITNNMDLLEKLIQNNFKVGYELNNSDEFNLINQSYPGISYFVCKNKDIERHEVELIQSLGKQVVIFEMRSAMGIRRALRKNPNTIITDDLREALIEVY